VVPATPESDLLQQAKPSYADIVKRPATEVKVMHQPQPLKSAIIVPQRSTSGMAPLPTCLVATRTALPEDAMPTHPVAARMALPEDAMTTRHFAARHCISSLRYLQRMPSQFA
jgi:hypothetical protein